MKRDKDHTWKWIEGKRPLGGLDTIKCDRNMAGDEPKWTKDALSEPVKVRPRKQWSQMQALQHIFSQTQANNEHSNPYYKTHANRMPRINTHTWKNGCSAHRVWRKLEATVEANSCPEISRSMLELVPHHTPNNSASIKIAIHTPGDEEMPYPLEYSAVSPTKKGQPMGLGSLIEKAEEKFLNKQTELLVNEDYEVLDVEGESVVLKTEKKRKGSPKQKAKAETKPLEEDDGFELI